MVLYWHLFLSVLFGGKIFCCFVSQTMCSLYMIPLSWLHLLPISNSKIKASSKVCTVKRSKLCITTPASSGFLSTTANLNRSRENCYIMLLRIRITCQPWPSTSLKCTPILNCEIRACITAMYQIIQEVSTEIAIFMTVAKLDKRILFFFFII